VNLDDKTRAFAQESVEKIYSTFVNRVAIGRKMTFDQVDAIGQGRVWSGSDAIKIGLIDEIGGMNKAIAEAAKLSKIKKYRTVNYPEFQKNFDDILSKIGLTQSKESIIKSEIGEENYILLQKLKKIHQLKGVQALMPYKINIK
jgi:protease-4